MNRKSAPMRFELFRLLPLLVVSRLREFSSPLRGVLVVQLSILLVQLSDVRNKRTGEINEHT